MLPRSSGSNDAVQAHSLGEHCLCDGVVDLVGSAVVEILSLQVNLRAFSVAILVVIR